MNAETGWTWAHYSADKPLGPPVCLGETYPTEAQAREALVQYLLALDTPHRELALQQLTEDAANPTVVLLLPDAVLTTRAAGAPQQN